MKNMESLKIAFLGTPEFVVPIFKELVAASITPFLVITQPDESVGRKKVLTPPPVKVWAQENSYTVEQPASKKELTAIIEKYQPDVCVLVAFGQIVPQAALDAIPHGIINIHPSLLPKYRGPSPIQSALLNGDTQIGVTIMKLDAEMDHGPVLVQEVIEVGSNDDNISLHEKAGKLGAQLIAKVLPEYIDGLLIPSAQDDSQATYCEMIARQDGELDWALSATALFNRYRAFQPWPGVFTYFYGKRLKIVKMTLLQAIPEPLEPGKVVQIQDEIVVGTSAGAIELKRVQIEGKPEMDIQDFVRGYRDLIGATLGS